MCGERGGVLLGLHGVRVHAEKETIFFLFPNDPEIPTGFSLRFLKVAPVAKYGYDREIPTGFSLRFSKVALVAKYRYYP